MLNRYGLVSADLVDLVEAEERGRQLERKHSTENTPESAMALSRHYARTGNHRGVVSVLQPHVDALDEEHRNLLGRHAITRVEELQAKHAQNRRLPNHELEELADTYRAIPPTTLNRSNDPIRRRADRILFDIYNGEGGNVLRILSVFHPGGQLEARHVEHRRGSAYTGPLHREGDRPARTTESYFSNGQPYRYGAQYFENGEIHRVGGRPADWERGYYEGGAPYFYHNNYHENNVPHRDRKAGPALERVVFDRNGNRTTNRTSYWERGEELEPENVPQP